MPAERQRRDRDRSHVQPRGIRQILDLADNLTLGCNQQDLAFLRTAGFAAIIPTVARPRRLVREGVVCPPDSVYSNQVVARRLG